MRKHVVGVVVLASWLFSGASLAGGLVNNGGKVVVCGSGADQKIELFDYYEAHVLRGWSPDLGQTQDVQAMIDVAIARLAKFDALRAEQYRQWSRSFMSEAELLTSTLPSVPDQEPVMDPPQGCSYQQMVIQRQPTFPGDKRYFIDKALFESPGFSLGQKAGLILHEIIYREAISFGATNSIGARYVNSLFSSDPSAVVTTLEGYWNILKSAGFTTASARGIWIDLTKIFGFDQKSGEFSFGSVVPGTTADTRFGDAKLDCQVVFKPDGTLEAFSLAEGSQLRTQIGGMPFTIGRHLKHGEVCDQVYDVFDFGADSGRYYSPYWLPATSTSPYLVSGFVEFSKGKIWQASDVNDEQKATVVIEGTTCTMQRGKIAFGPGGDPVEFQLKRCEVQVDPNSQGRFSNTIRLRGHVEIFAGGILQGATLDDAMPVQELTLLPTDATGRSHPIEKFKIKAYPVAEDSRIDAVFYKNGTPAMVVLGEDAELAKSDGTSQKYLVGTQIGFNEYGQVVSANPLEVPQ